MSSIFYILYLIAAVCFIMALRGLSSPTTARQGNLYAIGGMVLAIVTTLALPQVQTYGPILLAIAIGGTIGAVIAKRIAMTAMPQLVAAFHSLVGLAAVLIAAGALWSPEAFGLLNEEGHIHGGSLIEMSLGVVIGAITFTGSIVAFAKLQGLVSGAPVRFPLQHKINALIGIGIVVLIALFFLSGAKFFFIVMTIAALALGVLLIIPIGGADMPVVVSMLNSYSGWAAAGIGFTLGNPLLIIAGALIGASGAILSYIMCKAMNRSIFNVILGGFGSEADAGGPAKGADDRPVKSGAPDDAAFLVANADSVIIVPGYGMAVSQAQHAVRELAEELEHRGVKVKYAIHPVAGRMPGHMNVLLAEANIPYEAVFELEEINNDFATTDVVYVIGANDVTNPAAKTDPKSPIYGMPVLNVADARNVIFNKRGMAAGYAGIQNELFFKENTMMLFGDAKKATEELVKALKAL
jgi:NAD(P) transhydrogenase subunit beta